MENDSPSAILDTPSDARTQDIEKYTAPYHIHFMEGAEGHSLNPEGAEHNFDASIVLTKLIREQTIVPKKSTEFPEQVQWFEDKYPDSDVRPQLLKKPSSIINTWLSKLGPHNDMTEAEDDLLSARNWLVNQDGGLKKAHELELVAELNIELADQSDGDTRMEYLKEAATYLHASRDKQAEDENYGEAALTQARLSSVRLEMKRQELYGSRLLTNVEDEESASIFEQTVTEELEQIDQFLVDGITQTASQIERFDNDKTAVADKKSRKNVGVLFEALTYSSLLSELLVKGKLATSSIKIGTSRQERGTSHKITKPVGEESPDKQDGFNFNYDLEYNEINPASQTIHGLYSTVYVQNKLDAKDTNPEQASATSQRFFAGKEFRFLSPGTMNIDTNPTGENVGYQEEVYNLSVGMLNYLRSVRERRGLETR